MTTLRVISKAELDRLIEELRIAEQECNDCCYALRLARLKVMGWSS